MTLEPDAAPSPAETPAQTESDQEGSAQEAEPTPTEAPTESTPAETTPTDTTPTVTAPTDEKPAEDPAGCTSSATADAAPAGDAATEEAPESACPPTDDETPASCTSDTSASGTSDGATPTGSCAALTESAPTTPAKPAPTMVVVPPASTSAPAAAPTGPTVMVLAVAPATEASAAAHSDADQAPLDKPVAVVALPNGLPPTEDRQIQLGGAATDEEWLGAVRALSPLPTLPQSARGCVQPDGLVPLSNACMTTRARAGPLLAMRLEVWPSIPTTAAEINEAARNVARARDNRPARAAKKMSTPPTVERAPVSQQQRGPWVSRGAGGGSAPGSVVLRLFALVALAALPFALPRGFRVALRRSLVPTGELGLSLPERPG